MDVVRPQPGAPPPGCLPAVALLLLALVLGLSAAAAAGAAVLSLELGGIDGPQYALLLGALSALLAVVCLAVLVHLVRRR